jgi:hypothetical protein
MTVAEAVGVLPRRMSGWAAQASLAPNSLTGISVSLGVCAAVWFTAGTRWGNLTGALVLCGSYLAGRAAVGPREVAAGEERLAGVCAVVTECGVCAGLAVGGLAAGGPAAARFGMWQLATAAVILLAVSQLAVACGRRPAAGSPGKAARFGMTWRILAFPYGGRVLLIAVAGPALGTRAALFGLLGGAVIALGYAVVAGWPRRAGGTGARPIAACRDDGPVASAIGRPIRGQLVPLPPALTGLAAVCVLAILGLRDLPGFLLLAPVVAMLLAAVGSSHPHDGRLDWIVPAVLQAGQYVYIAAIGFASGVPAPVIFALCALIAVHYADLAGHAQLRTALGWDGRMIAAGLGAALGIATFAYLLIAAYVVVLICREVMTSWLPATEGDRR